MNPLCKWCGGRGLIAVRYHEEPGYDLAVCKCAIGQRWRNKALLKTWIASRVEKPLAVDRLETFFTENELAEQVGVPQ